MVGCLLKPFVAVGDLLGHILGVTKLRVWWRERKLARMQTRNEKLTARVRELEAELQKLKPKPRRWPWQRR